VTAKKHTVLVGVMALGTFVVVLDNTIMNVSISALVKDLHTTVSGVQTAIALNALMMAAFVLMGGKLADIIGMKRTFFSGAVIYVAGSLLASFSDSLAVFILGWCAIQGLGAALMLPNVNTIIRAQISGSARAGAYGTMAGINALGTAVGPIIGGFLTTYFSWRWAFRLEVGILAVVLTCQGVVPKDVLTKVRPSLDKAGVAWQAAAMVLLVLGTLAISDYGLLIAKQPLMIGSIAFAPFGLSVVPFLWLVGLLCLRRFFMHEHTRSRTRRSTLIDMALLHNHALLRSLLVRFLHVALIAGTTFAVPLYLQVTFGLSAFSTGFILLGLTAGLLTTALGGTRRGLRYLPKQKIRLGFFVCVVGLLLLIATMAVTSSPWWFLPGLFVYGLGLGLIASQIVNLALSAVRPRQTAEASGLASTLETLGSSMGTAVFGTLLVVAITAGISQQVQDSTVLPSQAKTTIEDRLTTSAEVVSSEVVADQIPGSSTNETEAIKIYDQARQNAFIITLLGMALVATTGARQAKKLPTKRMAII
jgi:MFS family permease